LLTHFLRKFKWDGYGKSARGGKNYITPCRGEMKEAMIAKAQGRKGGVWNRIDSGGNNRSIKWKGDAS